MYTLEAIVLNILQVQDKKYRLILFTREYGRITAWWYKSLSGMDIGDIAEVVIERKETLNTIKSFHTKFFLINKTWCYESLFQFLTLINILKEGIHDQEVYPKIFDDYRGIIEHIHTPESSQCLLFQMRILKQLGYVDQKFFTQDAVLQYIYTHITLSPLQKIIHSKPLTQEHKHIIHTSNLYALSFLA